MVNVGDFSVAVALPHELFSDLWTQHPNVARKRFSGEPGELLSFWDAAMVNNEPWFENHPLKSVAIGEPLKCIPIRLWGDDAPIAKRGRQCRAFSWTSAVVRLESLHCKMCAYCIDPQVVDFGMETELLKAIVWSINVMGMGTHPAYDHTGRPWAPASPRARLSGQPLSPEGHIGIYVETGGDWPFLCQIFGLRQSAWHEMVCHRCYACKTAGPNNYSNAAPDAPWVTTRRTTLTYLEDVVASPPPLTHLLGFELGTIADDLLHDDLLGVRLSLCGSTLRMLCDLGVWGLPEGLAWKPRLDAQLAEAYRAFRQFTTKYGIHHSQPKFKHTSLSMHTLTEWPVLKAKAFNCAMVSLFLFDTAKRSMTGDPCSQMLASTLFGFAAIWCLCSSAGQFFTKAQRVSLEEYRKAALMGYNWLSSHCMQRGVFMFDMRPKFHKVDESLRHACLCGRNPAWSWTFGDEDWIGTMANLSESCHKSTMHKRAMQRWLTHFLPNCRMT